MIALAIKRDSKGPVFYAGGRIGWNNEPFMILKFRTMRETPEAYNGPKITAQDNERIRSFLNRIL